MRALRKENKKLVANNQGIMAKNEALKVRVEDNNEHSQAMNEEVVEMENMMEALREQLEEAEEQLAFKDEEIENLQNKLQLTQFSDTAEIINAPNNGISHMQNNQTLTMNIQDFSSLTGLSHQQSLRAMAGQVSMRSLFATPKGPASNPWGNIPDEAPSIVERTSQIDDRLPLGVMSGIDPSLLGGVKETNQEEWMEELNLENNELKQRLAAAKLEIAELKGVDPPPEFESESQWITRDVANEDRAADFTSETMAQGVDTEDKAAGFSSEHASAGVANADKAAGFSSETQAQGVDEEKTEDDFAAETLSAGQDTVKVDDEEMETLKAKLLAMEKELEMERNAHEDTKGMVARLRQETVERHAELDEIDTDEKEFEYESERTPLMENGKTSRRTRKAMNEDDQSCVCFGFHAF